ncbi:unnamed protein product [Calypogeia fissa]
MCCTEIFLDTAAEGLRWLDNFWGRRCLNRGGGYITLKQQQQELVRDSFSDDGLEYNIIINPKFSDGTKGWFGDGCSLSVGTVDGDNSSSYLVAHGRNERCHGLAQEIGKRLENGVDYRVEAWVGIRSGEQKKAVVRAIVKVVKDGGGEEHIPIQSMEVKKGQWSLLTGILQGSDQRQDATLYIDGLDGGIDILVSSVAIVRTSSTTTTTSSVEMTENHVDLIPIADSRLSKKYTRRLKDDYFEVNIVQNSDFVSGLDYWYPMGDCTLTIEKGGPTTVSDAVRNSLLYSEEPILSGNYVLCSNRTDTFMGPCQDITDQVQLFQCYQIFCWVATTMPFGTVEVDVCLDVDGEWVQGGEVKVGLDWVQIQGSFRLESQPNNVQVYLQGPIAGVDIKLAGLQIFAVDRLARTHQLQKKADAIRKRDVVIKVRDSEGCPLLAGTRVSVTQLSNSFPLGSCINHDSLEDDWYVNFFLQTFNWAVFENELKWDQDEPDEGEERYKQADDMAAFCESNNVPMRGHCLVWDVNKQVPDWVQELDGMALLAAVEDRVGEVLNRYKGEFEHYDVNNEMLHGDFYEDKLGADFLPYLFKVCNNLDPKPLLFVNEYDVEDNFDCNSSPQTYVDLITFLITSGAPVGAIGIQGHLTVPIGSILSASLDTLSVLNLPIWFTEIDVSSASETCRADDLEVVLREAFAHSSVKGCLLWGFMEGAMNRENGCLVNADHTLSAAGQRLLDLKKEWTTNFECVLDRNGELVFRGYHGTYTVTVEGSVDGERSLSTFAILEGDGFQQVEVAV